jgi:hypothetical protein
LSNAAFLFDKLVTGLDRFEVACCCAFSSLFLVISLLLVMGNSNRKDETCNNSNAKHAIVYSDNYNIGFYGIEKLHPFDSKKYEKIFSALIQAKLINSVDDIYQPQNITEETLLLVHSEKYLKQTLQSCSNIARIVEIPPVALLPYTSIHSHLLLPMQLATAGSLLAAQLAIRKKFNYNTNINTGEANRLGEVKINEAEVQGITANKAWAINLGKENSSRQQV